MRTPFAVPRMHWILAVGLCGSALAVSGALQTFIVDPARSSLTLGGIVARGTINEQEPGSLTTRFTGALQVEVSSTAIQLLGGSQIDAMTNGVWEPAPGGSTGTGPADFGGKAQVLFTAKAALRNLLLDVTSPSIPYTNGQFNASSLTFAFAANGSSSLDYNAVIVANTLLLTGLATNGLTTNATLTVSGDTQTLTIPIDATHTFTLLTANDSILNLKGQLVATRSSPLSFQLTSIHVQNGNVILQWPNQPGKEFEVESSSDLRGWTVVATGITDPGPVITWSTKLTGVTGFYRVGME